MAGRASQQCRPSHLPLLHDLVSYPLLQRKDRGKPPRSFTPGINESLSNMSADTLLNAARGTPPIQELDDEQTLPKMDLSILRAAANIPEPQSPVDNDPLEIDRPVSSLGELPNLGRPKGHLEPTVALPLPHLPRLKARHFHLLPG